jgi:hypothetical protein
MPSKLTANTTSVARPHSISSTSSTKPKIASVPVRVSQASSESPKSGFSPRLQPLADAVQAQAQERPHQQEARRQRHHVGRRLLVDLQQRPAHHHEAAAVEQADARGARRKSRQPAASQRSGSRKDSGRSAMSNAEGAGAEGSSGSVGVAFMPAL